jgi:hypothetical protein
MPEPAPKRAAPDSDRTGKDSRSDRSDGSDATDTADEAERLAELATRFDPVPPEVTESARRAWRERLTTRRRER